MNKKLIIAKVLICAFALACVILVIFILSKSSVYFGYVFSLSTETTIKSYIKKYYQGTDPFNCRLYGCFVFFYFWIRHMLHKYNFVLF